MALKALIFDFDGLILDTELPEYHVWREYFRENGADLPLTEWLKCVGASFEVFNPYTYLEQQTGRQFDRTAIQARLEAKSRALILQQPTLPGVKELITAARRAGLRLAVASSSTEEWVAGHLTRLEIFPCFDSVCTGSHVKQVKPAPDVYQLALDRLGVRANEAVALEDSANGVQAAKQAGLFCIAVPNTLTNGLDFSNADLILSSIADLSLERLATRINSQVS